MNLNTEEVAELRPDYLGFIFWKPSSRFFETKMPALPDSIQKVGVFVDASIDEILDTVEKYELQAVQLHGNESPEFCNELRGRSRLPGRQVGALHDRSSLLRRQAGALESSPRGTNLQIIKVFSVKDDFDFSLLKPYEAVCDYYLFDTKGKLPGGNGYAFDWSVLENYPSTKPYFLSGGIGLEDTETIKEFKQRPEAVFCYAIDVNSKFEIKPGLKDVELLKEFREILQV